MMKNSWNIPLGSIRDVPIRVHGSFLLLIAWVVFSNEGGSASALIEVAFLLAVFLCVFLHECGHVFTGQWLGVRTRDITLYPFGGVATLLSQPTPKEEFVIAWAGPLVSFFLGGILYLFTDPEGGFVLELAGTNIALAVFNLIPAIPMDGGRIFRSFLALCRVQAATTIAARTSQVCSILLGLFGLYTHSPILVFISMFVFMGAVQEMMYSRTKNVVAGRTVDDLMIEREKLYCFQHSTTLSDAVQIALRSLQEVFPVIFNEELLGIVSRQELIEAVSLSAEEQYIAGLADRSVPSVPPHTSLDTAVRRGQEGNHDVIAVIDDGRFAGLVFLSNLGDVMIVDSLRKRGVRTSEEDLFPG